MSEPIESAATPDSDDRGRTLYWGELVQLKIDAEYVQRYRDHLGELLIWFEVGRAIVSVGALVSWVAGLGYPKLWAGVIVVSQVGEAILTKLPLTARHKALVAFGNALDTMMIDALLEWEDIQSGTVRGPEITRRWHTLMRLRHEAELKSLTLGLPLKRQLFVLAEQAATSYFERHYGVRQIR